MAFPTIPWRQIPTFTQQMVDGMRTNRVWYLYLQAKDNGFPPSAESPVTWTTGSPHVYVAPRSGFVVISGGTVSKIAIRSRSTATSFYDTGQTKGQFTLGLGDAVQITYSGKPTVTFFPL